MNLASKREKGDAGHFRIGVVTLQIPPEEITTHKDTSDEEVFPLRAKYSLHQTTGHSRWDVTVHWKAIAETGDYSQWEDLRTVLAMFKAAPFVEVENAHLRQILMSSPENGSNPDARMAFALRMLQISTVADIPQGLDVTLTMTWFNYLPFSYDFGYTDKDGMPVDAYQSEDFQEYLRTWKAENLDTPPNPFPDRPDLAAKYGYPEMAPWQEQTPGSLTFTWRNYAVLPRGEQQQQAVATQPSRPSPKASGRPHALPRGNSGKRKLMSAVTPPPSIKNTIVVAANGAGVDPNLCLAVSQRESGFDPSAKNPDSSATGLFQLVSGTAKQWGVSDPKNAEQNAAGGCKYIGYLLKRYKGDTTTALTAFAAGEGTVDRRGVEGAWAKYPWIPGWLDDIGNIYSQLQGKSLAEPSTVKADASPFNPGVPAKTSKTPVSQLKETRVPDDVIAAASQRIEEGWSLDHFTDRAIFLYREHRIELADEEHGEGPNDLGLYPVQTSVVFVNNIAAIPLDGHQYPTYQHVGPAGTMAVIGFASNGVVDGEAEPEHEGLSLVSGMCSAVAGQYQRLRGEWRSISSIHRMQAVVVENQVLNLLGLRGAAIRGWDTETVPDSPNLVQAHLKLAQYENVFEEIEPFQVKGNANLYQKVLQGLMADGELEKLTVGKQSSVFQPLIDYREKRKRRDPDLVWRMLHDRQYKTCPNLAMPVKLSQSHLEKIRKLTYKNVQGGFDSPYAVALTAAGVPLSNAVSWAEASPQESKRIQAGTFSYNDYFLLVNAPNLAKDADVAAFRAEVDAQIAASVPAPTPLDRLYDQALDYLVTSGSQEMARAMQELESAPEVRDRLKGNAQTGGPGLAKENAAHGAYRDLGLKSLQLRGKDFNPAYYFVDYSEQHRRALKEQAEIAARVSVEAANRFNRRDATTPTNVSAPGAAATADPSKPLFDPKPAAEAILQRTTLPSLSMRRAYPTFKLFLLEEDNSGFFYMFDDFYSYASVLSIEIQKSQNPTKDVAVLRITNFANLLSHRLFDGTVAGKKESSLSNLQQIPVNSNNDAAVGGVQAQGSASKSWLSVTRRSGLDLTQGFSKTIDAPLQYYPLQTGAKVQVRMGYSNNPDDLWPVFTGKVTQIDGEDVLEIVCQGYGIELTDPAPDDLSYDGFSLLGWTSPAYGGMLGIKESGRTESVIESILRTTGAKHFGHWQIDPGRNSSPFIKGFGWMELAATGAGMAGMKTAARLLGSGFDRRGENVSINRFLNLDGTTTDVRLTRGWQYEQPLYVFPAYYHVPKDDPSLTPWRLIRDISRRYSEYVLTVKPYGFPVGADATLVFANPNDVYITRHPLGDEESVDAVLASPANDDAFRSWWHLRGWKKFQAIFNDEAWRREIAQRIRDGKSATGVTIHWSAATKGDGVLDVTRRVDRDGRAAFQDVVTQAVTIANEIGFAARATGMADHASSAARFRKDILTLMNDLQNYILLQARRVAGKVTDPLPGDRIQPVRKWHLINQDVIVHNGIRLNDQVFNAVKVNRYLYQANSSIPKHYLRTLDCDPLIIAPKDNASDWDLQKSYAQSFLRDEIGKMYSGELVLAGCPEIEPYDVCLIKDAATGISGPVEVERVVHSFSPDTGFITVITPRALVIMNEAMTAGIQAALGSFFQTLPGEIRGAWQDLTQSEHPLLQAGSAALNVGGQAGIAVGGVLAAKAAAAFIGIGMFTGLPITLAALAGLGAIKLIMMAEQRQDALPIFVSPLNRFGRPWVGGLEGWALRDTHSLWNEQFSEMYSFEIAPTIEGFRRLNQIASSL